MRATLPERFWAKVDKGSTCWLWTGALIGDGYGSLRWGAGTALAHRVAYEALVGPIPDGRFIDHACRVRRCVNPDHLQPVTNKENLENLSGARADSATGVRGVSRYKRGGQPWRGVYQVRVRHNGVVHSGGYFRDLVEANAVAVALRSSLFTNNLADRT